MSEVRTLQERDEDEQQWQRTMPSHIASFVRRVVFVATAFTTLMLYQQQKGMTLMLYQQQQGMTRDLSAGMMKERGAGPTTSKPLKEQQQIAYEIALNRFQQRRRMRQESTPTTNTSTTSVAFPNLLEQLTADHGRKPDKKLINSVRIPKAGSSALSVTARALAGCPHEGYPCCQYPGNPRGSCPMPGLYCGQLVLGCTNHIPVYDAKSAGVPVITALREPSQRLLSAFFYSPPHRPVPAKDHSWRVFDRYIRDPRFQNVMTKMLSKSRTFAYHHFNATLHTVPLATDRLCQMAWFGISEAPILSALLLYEAPDFQRLIPNPVAFGLPVASFATNGIAVNSSSTVTIIDTTVVAVVSSSDKLVSAAASKGSYDNKTNDGLRRNTGSEYGHFCTHEFVRNNGTELVDSFNRQDLQLYEIAHRMVCARALRAQVWDAMELAEIGLTELAACRRILRLPKTTMSESEHAESIMDEYCGNNISFW